MKRFVKTIFFKQFFLFHFDILLSVISRFINEGGIGIEGMFPKNFSCEVISWGLDEKIALLTEDCFLEGCRFETNVFYTKESGTGRPLDEKKTPAKNIHIKTMMQSKDVKEDMYVQYRGAVRFSNVWQFIKPISKVI